jgi:cellulose synthase/poly-beta-1,6-N-acetylglucosamine synthase-like glycosyltransferase
MTSLAATVPAAVVGTCVAAPAAYLAALAIAASGYRAPRWSSDGEAPRLVLLVPAHDEAEVLPRCLRSLQRQRYPKDRFHIVVIADNCTDDTAQRAADLGVEVMVRHDPVNVGKGHALRWAMDSLSARSTPLDAVVIVDADSFADQGLLTALAARWSGGADAVQAEYLTLPDDGSPRAQLRAAAFLLFHRVRFTGRARLGLPCSLVGNGMLLSRRLLERHPWSAFTGAEDLEYSTDLRRWGVRPVYAGDALVHAPVSSRGRAARVQRQRWEGGRLHVIRTRLPLLLRDMTRREGPAVWDAALDLMVPPLGVLVTCAAGGAAITIALYGAGFVAFWAVTPWLAAILVLPAYVLVGLRAAAAPPSTFRALALAPLLVGSDMLTRLRVLPRHAAKTWERTPRPEELRRAHSRSGFRPEDSSPVP